MNLRTNQKGFTIVELLIVVVVIAILAAISIVAYTGITNRANRSAAMEAANSVKSVATTFQGTNGSYPASKAEFVSGFRTGGEEANAIAKLPADITFVPLADLDGSNAPKEITVRSHSTGSPSAIVGFTISYYDFVDKSVQTMQVGDTSTAAGYTTAILAN